MAVPVLKDELRYIIMYILVMVIVYIMVYQNKVEDFIHILILLIELTCIDGLSEKLIVVIFKSIEYIYIREKYQILISRIVVLIIFYVADIFGRKKKIREKNLKIEYIWIIVICMMTNILLTAAGLYVARGYVNNELFESVVSITNICSYLSVGLLILFVVYIRNTNRKLEQLLVVEKQLKEAQEQYYRSLLQKEEETRKNRHDWNNHLICLMELAQKEKALKTTQYIDTLKQQNNKIIRAQYDVGNDIINAILCYYFSDIKNDISIKVIGRCRKELKMNEVDLCVVVSNLIQNAIEYLSRCELKEKLLEFIIEEGDIYQRILIVNSVDKDVSERSIENTTKENKQNHGIGIQNVKDAIERNEGIFKIKIQDGKFVADIILK